MLGEMLVLTLGHEFAASPTHTGEADSHIQLPQI